MPGPERAEPTGTERIGILGGTFDPPHVGHIAAARAALDALQLDRLLLVVANDPWQKSGGRSVSGAEDRLALTEALAQELPPSRVEVSRLEIDRGGASFSVETAEAVEAEVVRRGGRDELFLIVGADLVGELESWHRAGDLKRLVTVAVVTRPTDPAPAIPPGWRVVWVDGPQVDVSSSEVRDRLAAGESVDGLVPKGVIRCIRRRGLYAVS